MRYAGQGAQVAVSLPYGPLDDSSTAAFQDAFERSYQQLYGRLVPMARPEVITWRLTGRASAESRRFEWGDGRVPSDLVPRASRPIYLPLKRAYAPVPVYDRYSVPPGRILQGPLILEENESTIVVAVAAEVTALADRTISITIKEFE
jgi:N-methylhydantoinase A